MKPATPPGSEAALQSDIGKSLGRIRFSAPDGMRYLHTSAAAGWRGAYLTHISAPPGEFEGSWSWLRLSSNAAPGHGRFPTPAGASLPPLEARLQIGIPGATYAGAWAVPVESMNLFVDPFLVESTFHVPYSDTRMMQAAQRLHADTVIERLFQALATDVIDGSTDGPVLGETIIAAMLHRLHNWRPAERQEPGARLSQSELRRLHAYVNENLAAAIHLHDMAGHLGISPRHLCRTLKATLGVTPHRYIVDCRIAHATRLLTTGRLTSEEIAEAVGFADRNHMSATFRRVLNATPLQIRHNAP